VSTGSNTSSSEEADEAAAAQGIARLVDGDPREPRLELGASLKLRQVRVGLDERVLRHTVGFHLVAHDGERDAKDLALGALHQDGKGSAVAGERSIDQLPVSR
jgi:hypothetical protein